jgi:putative ABC transport system ATP-binding protein
LGFDHGRVVAGPSALFVAACRPDSEVVAALLIARDLVKSYGADGRGQAVLRGVSMTVEQGEWVAVMGPSGCGKSTLLHLLGGLDDPDSGTVVLGDHELVGLKVADRAILRRQRVGYVFQQYNLIPHLNVVANIELPQRLVGAGRKQMNTRTGELLSALGLDDKAHALPSTLSGGEQQRVAIGRALANRPMLLLADEPTGALDTEASQGVIDLLVRQHAAGQTIVMVTHDPGVAAVADRTIHLLDGRVVHESALVP